MATALTRRKSSFPELFHYANVVLAVTNATATTSNKHELSAIAPDRAITVSVKHMRISEREPFAEPEMPKHTILAIADGRRTASMCGFISPYTI